MILSPIIKEGNFTRDLSRVSNNMLANMRCHYFSTNVCMQQNSFIGEQPNSVMHVWAKIVEMS